MFILKIKYGDNAGKYVGRSGFRGWAWKPQTDIEKARIFSSISGIKNWFGFVIKQGDKILLAKELAPIWDSCKRKEITRGEYNKKAAKLRAKYKIQVEERYEIISINLKENG